ncbi:ladderlectin-like [Thalassophryne amazonica]|uniref:ladderlectin-like n=1 Tax=Thalassophryne amazonica TaxID=390379 RepID=UPI0014715693|nr:ladderlectin-like [Thalassophryne amazonica]
MNFCPNGWFSYRTRCFLFIKSYKNWYNAEEHCSTLGGQLASVQNGREYIFLQQLTQGHQRTMAWLGGFNLQNKWMWIDRQGFYYTTWFSSSSITNAACTFLRSTSAKKQKKKVFWTLDGKCINLDSWFSEAEICLLLDQCVRPPLCSISQRWGESLLCVQAEIWIWKQKRAL